MNVEFATCVRRTALEYLQKVIPKATDTPDSAGPLLELVDKDILRIRDPFMYGNGAMAAVGGKNWDSKHTQAAKDAIDLLHSKETKDE